MSGYNYIEPQVRMQSLCSNTNDGEFSAAISLKRIADAIEHHNDLMCSMLDKLEAIEMTIRAK